jgi:hypothetical protein
MEAAGPAERRFSRSLTLLNNVDMLFLEDNASHGIGDGDANNPLFGNAASPAPSSPAAASIPCTSPAWPALSWRAAPATIRHRVLGSLRTGLIEITDRKFASRQGSAFVSIEHRKPFRQIDQN